jgi:hypothetical protein
MISTRTRIHTWRVPAPRKMLPTNGSTAIVGGFGQRTQHALRRRRFNE